jgi:serine/threonine protein kinase, bacterial
MIGQLLAGRYRVLQVLGAGGFGQTYITEDLHLPGQPKCVLKHLKPATDRADILALARQLFQKEAETLQQLGNHDRIPRLLAYFEEGQEFYLVQEFIVGHTLTYELISDQKWSESAVRRFLVEVLEILQFVHGQGVIHRDIKPDNLMRRDLDGKLILIDFGAIKQVRNQQFTQMGTAQQTVAIGTPGYMAPEQGRGNPRPSSDIYALGVIGIQALTGCYPTELKEDEHTGELQWQHFTNASPELMALLHKMTRYHFRDRYPNASAALQDLQVQTPTPSINGFSPTAPLPAQNPSTAATQVVSPAARPAQPAAKPQPLTDPRLETKPTKSFPWLLWGGLICSSGLAGYFFLPKIVSFKHFDQRLSSKLCRVAMPTKDKVTKVREKPDRTAPIKVTLTQGEKLLEVNRQDPFVQIERRDGSKGWVFNDQIDSCSGISIKPSPVITPTPIRSDPKPERRSASVLPSPTPKKSSPSPSPSASTPAPVNRTASPTTTPSPQTLDTPTESSPAIPSLSPHTSVSPTTSPTNPMATGQSSGSNPSSPSPTVW